MIVTRAMTIPNMRSVQQSVHVVGQARMRFGVGTEASINPNKGSVSKRPRMVVKAVSVTKQVPHFLKATPTTAPQSRNRNSISRELHTDVRLSGIKYEEVSQLICLQDIGLLTCSVPAISQGRGRMIICWRVASLNLALLVDGCGRKDGWVGGRGSY